MAGSTPAAKPDGHFISVEDFIRTRDSVVTGLTTLTGAINTLITAYIQHTNQLLSGGANAADGLDTNQLAKFLSDAGGLLQATPGVPAKKEKKKRVKKEKDPNAPKRPLTAFFLFSTNARAHVKNDLGDAATPVLVNDEILRRWKAMDENGKKRWKDLYETNNAQYKKEVEQYKAKTGNDLPIEAIDDEELPGAEELADAEAAAEDSSSDDSSEDETPAKPPTPVKAKTPKAGKRKAKENGAADVAAPVTSPSPSAQLIHKETPIPLPGEVPISVPVKEKSPVEKRKKGAKEPSPDEPKKKKARKSKGAEEATEVVPPSEKKEKKKKRKSEGGS